MMMRHNRQLRSRGELFCDTLGAPEWSGSVLQSWLACGGDDGRVSVYDTSRPDAETADGLPAQLVLQHIGHLGNIMDVQWSPHDPFLMMSVSNDGHTYKEGGACQMWRLSWLLHCDIDEAEQRLKGYQEWLVCASCG
jgi:WD40 repeat protein